MVCRTLVTAVLLGFTFAASAAPQFLKLPGDAWGIGWAVAFTTGSVGGDRMSQILDMCRKKGARFATYDEWLAAVHKLKAKDVHGSTNEAILWKDGSWRIPARHNTTNGWLAPDLWGEMDPFLEGQRLHLYCYYD